MLEIVNPATYPGWDHLLDSDQASFFHTSAWASVISGSYHYTLHYFTQIEKGKLSVLVPVMGINSILTGKRGVSLPFTDICDPIASNGEQFQPVIDRVFIHGKAAGWKYLEFKGGRDIFQDEPASSYCYHHTLDLTRNEQDIFSSFKSNTRRNIKKAIRQGVKIDFSNSLASVRIFYRLHCITRKRHGLPPQPLYFFKKIYEHIISQKKGFVVLAPFQENYIAGAIYFRFGNTVIYKYGASNRSFQHLRANNLIMWEAIKWSADNGFKSFSFGKTEPENKGLLRFKRGWSTKEEIINYYKYDLIKNCFVTNKAGLKTSYNLFKHMPVSLLRLTGDILYRHVG